MSIFVTGTDTHVGKTVVSALLCKLFLNPELGYFKPLQTGLESDSQTVHQLSGLPETQIARPCYAFPEPISPNRAARLNDSVIEILPIKNYFQMLPLKHYVVEGAGGVMVPINERETLIDLMSALAIPVLVVARTELGTLNHTLLTLAALKAQKLNCLGVICVGDSDPGLGSIITEHSGAKILAEIPRLETLDALHLARLAESVLGLELKNHLAGLL